MGNILLVYIGCEYSTELHYKIGKFKRTRKSVINETIAYNLLKGRYGFHLYE